MKRLRRARLPALTRAIAVLLALGSLASLLAGCGARVHTGGDTVAFLRDGTLWVILDDGTGARAIAGNVAGYAWSPDHHALAYRTTSGGSLATLSATSSRRAPDAPGGMWVASISGGVPLQLTPSESATFSDAWWNANGNRMVYRETGIPGMPIYVVSQADQPVGIARKALLDAAGLPVLSADGQQVAAVDADGALRLGAPGSLGSVIASHALLTLPNTGRPAHLLWQPRTSALLYPASGAAGGITLTLINTSGTARAAVTVPQLLDAAFSPDGSRLLVRTPDQFQLWRLGATAPTFSWPEADPEAMPWWSPNGQYVLVQDTAGWQLVDLAHQTVHSLLHAAKAPSSSIPADEHPASRADWRPAAGSPWSADGTRIVFAAAAGDTWRGAALPGGASAGLYVAPFAGGSFGAASAIDNHADAAPSWSYLDPSVTYLVSA